MVEDWQSDDPNLELGLERVMELDVEVESPSRSAVLATDSGVSFRFSEAQ